MAKQTWNSGSNPAARIFNRALRGCWSQPPSKSDLGPNSKFRHDDSQQRSDLTFSDRLKEAQSKSDTVNASNEFRHDSQLKSILGSNHSVSLRRSAEELSEVSKNDEIPKFEAHSESQNSDYGDVGRSDNLSTCTEQEENLASYSPIRYPNMPSVKEYNTPDASKNQQRKIKSVISIINNHLLDDSDSSSTKSSLKRTSSGLLNSSFEFGNQQSNNCSASDVFMSERRSDTALLRLEPTEISKSRHSTPKYMPGKSDRNITFKSRSFEFHTPNSRFSDKRNDVRYHRRSLTYPNNKRSAADVTPYSPLTRSSEFSSERRIKKMRTGSYIPSYDLKGISLKLPIRVIDSHCHLDFLFTREDFHSSYSDYRSKHAETFPDCYEGCITIFCEPQNFLMKPSWDRILQEEGVWAAFGCHPHMANNYSDEAEEALVEAMKDPKVVALGEIGLDYSRRNNCDRERQKSVLCRQLRIALDHKRPLVIHCREAHDDCIEIMKELVPRNQFIHLHCFTDTWERAEEWLKEFPNLYIGITNLVTFPSAEDVHEIARKIPIDRLLVETDTPYFVPRVLTMRWSHPGMVIHAAAQIAAFRTETSLEDLLRIVRDNTFKVYGI